MEMRYLLYAVAVVLVATVSMRLRVSVDDSDSTGWSFYKLSLIGWPASVFNTLDANDNPSTNEEFAFYKLSLQWPATTCKSVVCKKPIPNYFTIHGLWPQFADDTPVPPYNQYTNPCTRDPKRASEIGPLLKRIRKKLNRQWPDLYLNRSKSKFWRYQWRKHGMCSDYPRKPKGYFQAGLTLADNHKPLDVIGIQPGEQTTVERVLINVKEHLGKYPEITCKPGTEPRQLWEVRFCFDRAKPPSSLRDCPKQMSGCGPKNDTNISLPAARVPDELNIIRQVGSV